MRQRTAAILMILLLGASGCRSRPLKSDHGVQSFQPFLQQIEYPDVKQAGHGPDVVGDLLSTPPPPSVRNPEETPKWELTLEEAIRIALSNSQVIRDLGGRVIRQPSDAIPTVFDPALRETDARFGVEAALAAFDAQLFSNFYLERIDRRFNNIFFASAGNQRQQNQWQTGITKTAATGTQFTLENITNYERIVGPGLSLADLQDRGNRYEHFYETIFQARVRHPLLQGAGVEFNRIAGPNATPGNYNGVLLARIDTDISLAQFQAAVRDLLRDVEQTYWELYFAYQDLHTKQTGRDTLLRIWQLEQRRLEVGTGRVDDEARAREQYFVAQALVENSLTTGGFVAFGTGATTRSQGVYEVENQLRGLLGIPASDGRLIVPATEPVKADVRFDWGESLAAALSQRVELRQQQWRIKRRELELAAARNFRRMRLDLVGEYRFRGFGDDLLGDGNSPPIAMEMEGPPISAFKDLFNGDYQEYRVGLELRTPVGNRIGHTAARNAELALTRERAIMDQMQLRIATDLRTAFTELGRAYTVSRSNYNRAQATLVRTQAESRRERVGEGRLDPVLEAIRQYVDADIQYHRAIVDYNLALLNMHFTRGTLFDYHEVYLAEGPWVAEAYESARKQSRNYRPRKAGTRHVRPQPISGGPVPRASESYELIPAPDTPQVPREGETNGVEQIPVPPAEEKAGPMGKEGGDAGTLPAAPPRLDDPPPPPPGDEQASRGHLDRGSLAGQPRGAGPVAGGPPIPTTRFPPPNSMQVQPVAYVPSAPPRSGASSRRRPAEPIASPPAPEFGSPPAPTGAYPAGG